MFAGRKNGLPRWVTALAAALGCAALAVQWGRNMAARCGALRAWRRALTRMEAGMSLYADLPSLLFFAAEGEENGEVAQELFGCARRMRDDPSLPLAMAAAQLRAPSLHAADRAALAPLWQSLGSVCGEESRMTLKMVLRSVDECIRDAEERQNRNRRLVGSIACIGSLTVFLFLL